ncbi:hypothetical protein GCM10009099_39400 [Caenispirillum bisanense]
MAGRHHAGLFRPQAGGMLAGEFVAQGRFVHVRRINGGRHDADLLQKVEAAGRSRSKDEARRHCHRHALATLT